MVTKTIILLSDLHIGLREKESKRTKYTFEKIGKSYPQTTVLITGDLTDSATTSQFKRTRKLLDGLAQTNPILTVPGNHDYAWKGNFLWPDGWKKWVEHLGAPLGWGKNEKHWMGIDAEPEGIDGLGVWKDKSCVYFGIDSGDPLDKQVSARGYISKKLANSLRESLKKYEGKTRIALLHHHPFTDGLFTKLSGSKMLMDALEDNCELLLFGHQHEYGIWWGRRGLPLIVSSHKSTDAMSGDCMMITVIDIEKAGTQEVAFRHRMEIV